MPLQTGTPHSTNIIRTYAANFDFAHLSRLPNGLSADVWASLRVGRSMVANSPDHLFG